MYTPLDILTDILGLDVSKDNLHPVIGYFVSPCFMLNKENTTEGSDTQVDFGGLFILTL